MDNSSRVVVVGAGLGGLRTVQRLRQRGFAGELVLLGAERHHPYDRPPLSKQILRGESEAGWLATPQEWDSLDCDGQFGVGAERLDLLRRVVHTDRGEVGYDALVIATGATPRRLDGIESHVLRSLDDALGLRRAFQPGRRLVVLGGGLIGCEVAASARAGGLEVDVIEPLTGPAIRVLGPTLSALLADLHRDHGVRLHLEQRVTKALPDKVILDDGTVLPADLVLTAIGVRPSTDWLIGSGLDLDDGVVCSSTGQAAPDVWAVGDAARWDGRRHEHWTNVGVQADAVAAVLLGQEVPAAPVSYWWSDQYEIKLQGLGNPGPDDDVQVLGWGPRERPLAIYSRAGRITGAVGFSATPGVMRLREHIAAGAALELALAAIA